MAEGKLRGAATRAILVDSKQEGLEDRGQLAAGGKGEGMNRKIGTLWILTGLLSSLLYAQSWRGAEAVGLQVNDRDRYRQFNRKTTETTRRLLAAALRGDGDG